mgnify:CR=1 FL=1
MAGQAQLALFEPADEAGTYDSLRASVGEVVVP